MVCAESQPFSCVRTIVNTRSVSPAVTLTAPATSTPPTVGTRDSGTKRRESRTEAMPIGMLT